MPLRPGALAVDGQPCCDHTACRSLLQRHATLPPRQAEQLLAMQRTHIRQQRQAETARLVHEQAVRQRENQQDACLAAALAPLSADDHRAPLVVAIPSGGGRVVQPPSERLLRYREHLQAVVTEAFSQRQDPSGAGAAEALHEADTRLAALPGLRERSDAVCSHCAGGCCHRAGDRAYLTAATIRRQLTDEPQASAEDLLARYLRHLPERIVDGACINQTPSGCALPRELRSDTCNAFYCDSLQGYQRAAIEQEALPGVLLVQRDNRLWDRFDRERNAVRSIVLIDGEAPVPIMPPPTPAD